MKKKLKIKLSRFGKKHAPFFRIGVMPTYRSPNRQSALEFLGYYNPATKEFKVNEERVKYYLSINTDMTPTVHALFVKNSLIKL